MPTPLPQVPIDTAAPGREGLPPLRDTVVVGGGLCGLAVAQGLQADGADWALFEARPRWGGRVLTVAAGAGGPWVDLGPAWHWPSTQPAMTRLVRDLGLDSVAQPDDGRVLWLHDPAHPPRLAVFDPVSGGLDAEGATPAQPGALHGGARRVSGGMAAVIDAMVARLPAARLHAGQPVSAIVDAGDHFVLHAPAEMGAANAAAPVLARARQVIVALPPRVVADTIRFDPPLPAPWKRTLRDTPTWMAQAAKAAVACGVATWRERGEAGNAWVTHSQAMLAESYDAGTDAQPALAGFVAPAPAAREALHASMPLLLDSQVTMLHGPACAPGAAVWQDWSTEPWTCAVADRADPGGTAPGATAAAFDAPVRPGRLWLSGSETAARAAGYLEGALVAAARTLRQWREARAAAAAATAAAAALDEFDQWVQAQRRTAVDRYRAHLHRVMSTQSPDGATHAAVLAALQALYDDALQQLSDVPAMPAPAGEARHPLTPRVLQPFVGLADELLADALVFNAGSCALSNFPQEHRPPGDAVRALRREMALAWQDFALAANDSLHRRC